MSTLVVQPAENLRGTVTVPGDKSISHRALMLGALAQGENLITGWLPGGDNLATLGVIEALGVPVTQEDATTLRFEGRPFSAPAAPLDCVNAGTLMRLIAGLLAWQPFESVLDGSEQLRKRPMRRITEPLRLMEADITDTDGRAPLHIRPARLRSIDFRPRIASAQVKSAILLAGLGTPGHTIIHEPGPGRDHTERMLQAMGAPIHINGSTVSVEQLKEPLQPLRMHVPGDISSAAFVMVAAAITPGADVTIERVGINPTRTGIIDALMSMGADIKVTRGPVEGGEQTGTVHIKGGRPLKATVVSDQLVVRSIDELPVLAVAATQAQGRTVITDAAELRVKEVDRIAMLAGQLRTLGAHIDEQPDGMILTGPTPLKGTDVHSYGDHRLAMALAVAGLVAEGETSISEAECAADSFPGFTDLMRSLGAHMQEVEAAGTTL